LTLVEQLWGRAFRSPEPTIIQFVDPIKTCESHFKDMQKVARMYHADVQETQEVLEIK
jgi:hypothetical protein